MARVFVSGSFDLLHSGHITFLKEAAQYGTLYVGIGTDRSVAKYKGKWPVCNEAERLFMLKAIRYVEDAWINSGEGPNDCLEDLKRLQPDFMVVNEDQDTTEKEELCEELGITYIVLKREQEKELPVRTTTTYRKFIEFDREYGL
jgi:cytidyltransferase-like protein